MSKKWMHSATITISHGKAKLTCSCGMQTRQVPAEEKNSLLEQHTKHTGLIEKQPGARKDNQ